MQNSKRFGQAVHSNAAKQYQWFDICLYFVAKLRHHNLTVSVRTTSVSDIGTAVTLLILHCFTAY
jgi:hypothetical protein